MAPISPPSQEREAPQKEGREGCCYSNSGDEDEDEDGDSGDNGDDKDHINRCQPPSPQDVPGTNPQP